MPSLGQLSIIAIYLSIFSRGRQLRPSWFYPHADANPRYPTDPAAEHKLSAQAPGDQIWHGMPDSCCVAAVEGSGPCDPPVLNSGWTIRHWSSVSRIRRLVTPQMIFNRNQGQPWFAKNRKTGGQVYKPIDSLRR